MDNIEVKVIIYLRLNINIMCFATEEKIYHILFRFDIGLIGHCKEGNWERREVAVSRLRRTRHHIGIQKEKTKKTT
jgi:hypothetical protein